jgi:DNA-binding transcriptional MerR regulator
MKRAYVAGTKMATTAEAARRAGIHPVTLQRWIGTGKVKAPKPTLIGAVGYRLWSEADVDRLCRVKQQIYRRGRGRKPKLKR